MKRAYYSASIHDFLRSSTEEIVGKLSLNNDYALIQTQRDAWVSQIDILRTVLANHEGSLYFEYSIPRIGRRIDAILLIGPVIFVVEFKVGEKTHTSFAFDQVFDYALDLKNFHESSHEQFIAPILVATEAAQSALSVSFTARNDKLLIPVKTNREQLGNVIDEVLSFVGEERLMPVNGRLAVIAPLPQLLRQRWPCITVTQLPKSPDLMREQPI